MPCLGATCRSFADVLGQLVAILAVVSDLTADVGVDVLGSVEEDCGDLRAFRDFSADGTVADVRVNVPDNRRCGENSEQQTCS